MLTPIDILGARILVVDDSSVNVLLLERILQSAGYTSVMTTTDPRAVVELYREHRHDLILLDLLMPGMDGFDVMRGLKDIETEGYLPVLVITAQPGHKLLALKAGAKDFVTKPFDQIEVLTRIHNMLEVRLLLRESHTYARLLERYDPLTGLPNRRLFRVLLTRTLEQPDENQGIVSVLFVAIDRFRNVNDALGRDTGGALLRQVGELLGGCIGPMDSVGRLEGDQFGLVVVTPAGDPHGARLVARKVRDALRLPLTVEGHEIAVTASVGITVSTVDSADPDTLLLYADRALDEAKAVGGDTYRFYSAEMNVYAIETLEMETSLRSALERQEFVLYYQPKMRVDSGEWSGAEALLRWQRPGHGLVSPSAFIPTLEETGLIVPVGDWVIETVCRQIGEWIAAGLGPMRVAVNVSGKQFLRHGFVAAIAKAIRDNDIPPDSLDIEITESSLMSRSEEADRVLKELKVLGVWIAIDDFGTGYSSLAYLRRFPIDTLKIDISFIRDITTSADGAAIAVAIINLARTLKMKVVAEGVETQPQLEFLRQHACDEIQGFYCSRPIPAAELAKLRGETRGPTPSSSLAIG